MLTGGMGVRVVVIKGPRRAAPTPGLMAGAAKICPAKLAGMPSRTALSPGVLSPTRPVPNWIARPEYVPANRPPKGQRAVGTNTGSSKMRVAGRMPQVRCGGGQAVARGSHRQTRPDRARIPGRQRRLLSTLGYKDSQSCCTSGRCLP